jgi:23S rRNA pseudouridine2605 synthase
MSDRSIRLQKFLADAGICSRRKAETLIEQGKVYVNGRKAELGQKVNPENDRVLYRGKEVQPEETFTFLFNKPRGFLCNPDGRREGESIFDAFPELRPYRVVLGLSRTASGLILLSNDGNLLQSLSSQQRYLSRIFRVRLQGPLDEKLFKKLAKGIRMDDRKVQLDNLKLLKQDGEKHWYEFSLTDVRDQLVEKLFKMVSRPVGRVIQVEVAGLRDDLLERGKGRPITPKEREQLLIQAGVKT